MSNKSTAIEIAQLRLARGEISEQDYLMIIEKISSTSHGQRADTTAAAGTIDSSHGEYLSSLSLQESLTRSELIEVYEETVRLRSLRSITRVIEYTCNIVMFIYAGMFIMVFANRSNVPVMNQWLSLGSADLPEDPIFLRIAIVALSIELFLIIIGLAWIYRATRNLFYFRIPQLTISPAWSVGWFFIPIAFFWKPLYVMHQIYAGTIRREQWQQAPIDGKIYGWLGLFWLAEVIAWFLPMNASSNSEVTIVIAGLAAYTAVSIGSVHLFSELTRKVAAATELI